jgi:hypothetical protein
MTERFYSGDYNGTILVRDGATGTKTRLPEPKELFQLQSEAFARLGVGSEHARLALTLLQDALSSEARALKACIPFSRRVIPLLPGRWTITRSRVQAYVDMLDRADHVGLEAEENS